MSVNTAARQNETNSDESHSNHLLERMLGYYDGLPVESPDTAATFVIDDEVDVDSEGFLERMLDYYDGLPAEGLD